MYGIFDEDNRMLWHGLDRLEAEQEKKTLETVDGLKNLYIDELDEEEEQYCD